jgi:hypothetical protein
VRMQVTARPAPRLPAPGTGALPDAERSGSASGACAGTVLQRMQQRMAGLVHFKAALLFASCAARDRSVDAGDPRKLSGAPPPGGHLW